MDPLKDNLELPKLDVPQTDIPDELRYADDRVKFIFEPGLLTASEAQDLRLAILALYNAHVEEAAHARGISREEALKLLEDNEGGFPQEVSRKFRESFDNLNRKAFHGDPTIKAKYVTMVREAVCAEIAERKRVQALSHDERMRELNESIERDRTDPSDSDEWISDDGDRYSAVALTVGRNNYALFEQLLGIPTHLARLQEGFGFALQHELEVPLQFLEAIPVGSNQQDTTRKYADQLLLQLQDTVQLPYQREAIAKAHAVCRYGWTDDRLVEATIALREASDKNETEKKEGWFGARFALGAARDAMFLSQPNCPESCFGAVQWEGAHALAETALDRDLMVRASALAGNAVGSTAEMISRCGRVGEVIGGVLITLCAGPAFLMQFAYQGKRSELRDREVKRQWQALLHIVRTANSPQALTRPSGF